MVGSRAAGVTTLKSLKGKTLAVPGELRGEDVVQLFPALLRSWGLRPVWIGVQSGTPSNCC